MAAFASAEKAMPWECGSSQQLRAATLLQPGFIFTPEELTIQIHNDFTTV